MLKIENNFVPADTFDCGQCFRWNRLNEDRDDTYIGVAGGRICKAAGDTIYCGDAENEFWSEYFAVGADYDAIKAELLKVDDRLEKCIEFGKGIRILKQDIWETIISFIISANNNIPRIKKIIETLCRLYGDEIEPPPELGLDPGAKFYSFPSAERLMELEPEDLGELRAGYRDKYIIDAARKVGGGEVDLAAVSKLDTPSAKKELMKIKGVGGKVADCILLFSMGRFEVFPKDVWIKRVLSEVYGVGEKDIDGFVRDTFGMSGGYAQQYLYYYYRENS